MLMVETKFDCGALVAMVNDPDENVGIVSGYKVMPDGPVEYLIIWNPSMSSWAYDFEIKGVSAPVKKLFPT